MNEQIIGIQNNRTTNQYFLVSCLFNYNSKKVSHNHMDLFYGVFIHILNVYKFLLLYYFTGQGKSKKKRRSRRRKLSNAEISKS